jgi:hypothetical protein
MEFGVLIKGEVTEEPGLSALPIKERRLDEFELAEPCGFLTLVIVRATVLRDARVSTGA